MLTDNRGAPRPAIAPPQSASPYSSGAFLNIVDHDVDGWQRRAAFLRALPGLTHIELWLEQLDLDEGELLRLHAALEGLRVTVQAPYLQLSMVSHHDLVRGAAAETYRRALRISAALGAEVITFCGGSRPFFLDETIATEQIASMLAALRETLTALGSGAHLAVKNLPVVDRAATTSPLLPFPATLDELHACLQRMPDLLISLDVGNCTYSREGWIAFLRAEAPRIIGVHLHDAHIGGATHLPLGTGVLDHFALARLLRAAHYQGYVSLAQGSQRDIGRSWELWRRAQEEAAQETTAALANVSRPPRSAP